MSRQRILPLVLLVTVFLLLVGCAEDSEQAPPLRTQERAILVGDLPRMGGDYPLELINGLSAQLVDEVNCIQPGVLQEFVVSQTAGHLYTDRNIPHLLRPEVVAAAEAVAALKADWITITSGYRDVGMQYYDWVWGQKLGFPAARPGASFHQGGQAMDLAFPSYWRSDLLAYGVDTNGDGTRDVFWECYDMVAPICVDDAPHFQFVQTSTPDLMVESVRAFQRLWNRNNPNEPLVEDGAWGPGTEAKMEKTDAAGFAYGGCDLDKDGYAATTIGGDDCRDDNAAVHPGATEVCGNGLDDNCDGSDPTCDGSDTSAGDTSPVDTIVQDTAVDTYQADTSTSQDTNTQVDTSTTTPTDTSVADTGGGADATSSSDATAISNIAQTKPDDGCGCRLGSGGDQGSAGLMLFVALMGGLAWTRARRRRHSS